MSAHSGRNSGQRRLLKLRLFGGRATAPCCFCRRVLTFALATLEHVRPLAHGGGWEIDNLRLACAGCNHNRDLKDFHEYKRLVRAAMERMARV